MLGLFSKITDAVGGLVTGVFAGIDSISTTEEEKLTLKAQIKGIAKRRDCIVELADQMIQEQGEDAVLVP